MAGQNTSFHSVEFHRSGFGLLPDLADKSPGYAFFLTSWAGGAGHLRSCTCAGGLKGKTCDHLRRVAANVREYQKLFGEEPWERTFADTLWSRLGDALITGDRLGFAEVVIDQIATGDGRFLRISSPAPGGSDTREGRELLIYRAGTPDADRLLERLGKVPKGKGSNRAELIHMLGLLQRTSEERALNQREMKTQRQTREASFWARLTYHACREFGDPRSRHRPLAEIWAGRFRPAIQQDSGDFHLRFDQPGGEGKEPAMVFRLVIPRSAVETVLKTLAETFPDDPALAIHPVPLRARVRVAEGGGDQVEVQPLFELRREGAEPLLVERPGERFRYGDLVYLKDLGVLARTSRGRDDLDAVEPHRFERSQVPAFLQEYRRHVAEGEVFFDPEARGLKVLRDFDRLEVAPFEAAPPAGPPSEEDVDDVLHRPWTWLSLRYGIGDQTVSLQRILEAKRQRQRYLETPGGWIDLTSPAFDVLADLFDEYRERADPDDPERLRLSKADVLRFGRASGKPVQVLGEEPEAGGAQAMERLLDLRPSETFATPRGLSSHLRDYQRLGVEWLTFLYENGLSGLLCDDMGLGKTHQTMALMLWLQERRGIPGPFLVICPRTVISHWRNKIGEHAPRLRVALYHGPERDLEEALARRDVVLTSYGMLRNDADRLAEVFFPLVVFDEIQYLKSPRTQGHQAALRLHAGMKLGLTGTPIENDLADLKALFDLILPGYLGADEAFARRYGGAAVEGSEGRRDELKRIVSPFTLRRLKTAVLDELPEKIEDVRTCTLSEQQVKLYRDAVAARGEALVQALENPDEPVPYIHVFALLNLLKQICDHPALALGKLDEAEAHESGKWDLFRELLFESLGAGHKVVVFSQYLGMLALMGRLLEAEGVGHVTLTGASRDRGELIRRFNEDPACRVFLGSLKAGGTGIDLVGGSVVIHYDRWWNAAREDQATDRVYRMGQKRAVQVFKLVTEGTLEDKIAAIIETKRQLMEDVVEADDPRLSKIFSRQQLLELLRSV